MAEYWCVPAAQHIDPDTLARDLDEPAFHYHLQRFLEDQLEVDATSSPFIYIPDKIYSSAITNFHTPSNQAMYAGQAACAMNVFMQSPPGGMTDPDMTVFWSTPMNLSKVCMEWMLLTTKLFFSVTMNCIKYPCALIH